MCKPKKNLNLFALVLIGIYNFIYSRNHRVLRLVSLIP